MEDERLTPEELAEMAAIAEGIKVQPQTRRSEPQNRLTGPERERALMELASLRSKADHARLDLHMSIARWSKVIDVSDVAVAAKLPRRTDVYRIVNELPRFKHRMGRRSTSPTDYTTIVPS